MKALKILSLLLIPSMLASANEGDNFIPGKNKPIVVAVIDTGINQDLSRKISLCRFGSKDFTGYGIHDDVGHGSHIAGIIDSNAKNLDIKDVSRRSVNYCMVILKFYHSGNPKDNTLANVRKALRYAINIKANIINLSISGPDPDDEERSLIKEALDRGIKVIIAAGNNGFELSGGTKASYPAMYDYRSNIVGNLDLTRKPASTSNRGSIVNAWEIGTDVVSFCKYGKLCKMSGTSQATAVKTGKIVRSLLLQQ